jgi:hypothetical protein
MPKRTNSIKKLTRKGFKINLSYSPTSITDSFHIAPRIDGGVLLRLISEAPDESFENHRTVILKDEVIGLIDMLCKVSDYYPGRKELKKKK